MNIFFSPDLNVGDAIDNMISNVYLREGKAYLDELVDPAVNALRIGRLEDVVEILFGAASDLADGDLTTVDEALSSLNAMAESPQDFMSSFRYVMTKMDLRLAEEISSIASVACGRFGMLLTLASRVPVSTVAVEFLKRVSRCYLFGMDVECAILCRSVLDVELQAEIPNDLCVSHLRAGGRGATQPIDLSDRIATAKLIGRFDEAVTERAHRLRKRLNPLVHRNPKAPEDINEIIGDTLAILSKLHSRGDRNAAR